MWSVGTWGHDRRWAPLLSAWCDGEVDATDGRALRAHVDRCPRCQTRLAAYQALDGRVRRLVTSSPAPTPRRIFDAVERRHPALPAMPRRVALASAAAFIIVGGAASPPGQAVAGGVAQYVQTVFAPAASYSGDNALLRAHAGDTVVYQQRRYSIMTASPDGASLAPLGQTLVSQGGVYTLAGGKVLYDAGDDGHHKWTVVDPGGSNPQPLAAAGDRQVMDVTPDGSEILLRSVDGQGKPATATGSTEVLNAAGQVLWTDATPADVSGINAFSLSADGRYVLSGDTSWVREYPVDGGDALAIPTTNLDVQRVQSAPNGSLTFTATALAGSGHDQTTLYFFANATGGGSPAGIPKVDPYSGTSEPLFALSPDGSRLAVWGVRQQSSGLTIWGVDGSAKGQSWQESRLPGLTVSSLRWSPDGRSLLVTGAYQNQAAAFVLTPDAALASATLTRLGADTNVAAAAWQPHGDGLIVLSDAGMPVGLVAVPRAGGPSPLLASADASIRPAFGADGHAALLSADSAPELMAAHGAKLASLPAEVRTFSWAPDGARGVAVQSGGVYPYDGRTGLAARPISDGTDAVWSPQGDRILVLHSDGSATVIDSSGRVLARAPDGLAGATLVWSPNGSLLAGVAHDASGDAVAIWNPASGTVTTLATSLDIGRVAWSPDGRSIAYGAADAGVTRLFVTALRNGQPRAIAALAAPSDDFVWQADGRSLLLIQHDALGAPGRLLAASITGSGARFAGLPSVTHIFAGPR